MQRGGNSGFFQLGQQTVVEGLVGFGVALEDVVLHHALGHGVGFDFLLVERAGEQFFALLRFVVVAFEARDNGLLLALKILVQFLELGLEAQYLGKVGAILIHGIRILTANVGALANQFLNGRTVADLRDDVGVTGTGKLEQSLLFHALALSID